MPGFTSIALLVIAVGIGLNTAVFTVVDAVVLKPLTYPDSQALVQLVTTSSQGPIPVASIPEYTTGYYAEKQQANEQATSVRNRPWIKIFRKNWPISKPMTDFQPG